MYSSLQLVALSFHQSVTDNLYRYRSAINWDRYNNKWFVEPFNLFIWKFINFVVVGFGVSTCAFVLVDAYYNPGKYHLFILFFILLECMLGITSILTCAIILENATDSVRGANTLQCLSFQLGYKTTSLVATNQMNKTHIGNKAKSVHSSLFVNANGQVDYVACLSIIFVVGLTLLSILLAPFALVMKWDAPYYLFKETFPNFDSNYDCQAYTIHLIRTFVAVSCVVEVCNTFRNVAMIALTTFQNIRLCVLKMFTVKPQVGYWKALRFALIQLNALTSSLLSLNLGMIFLLEIICITASVVAVSHLPWYMYIFFPWIGIQVFAFIIVMFSMLIYIHSESKRLKHHWIWWCAGKWSKVFISWKLKVKYRQFMALQPIGFTYASLGTVTKSTRTDYYYSILNYSISSILANR